MRKPPPINDADHARALAEFRTTYGMLMEAWARVEAAVFYWFMLLTGIEERMARAIYYSARSFSARGSMVDATLPLSPIDPAKKEFVKAALKKAGQYSGFRNRATHGEPVWNYRLSQYVLAEGDWGEKGPADDAITIRQMQVACRNFSELRRLMWELARPRSHVGSPPSPQGYLVRIRALANEASSSEARPQQQPQKQRPPRKPRA